VDVVPYPVDWSDLSRFYHFAGFVNATAIALGIAVRWGGDWNGDMRFREEKFKDLPHWELING
jgi:peptidoglycan L-alanyl-D-glutamate endopeptidase CwlK